jgi:hypothetical protein
MNYLRMLDKEHQPTPEEMVQTVGDASPLWTELHSFIESHYDILPEVIFGGKKYGWTVHYRKGGRTLCYLYPEEGAFTVLIVLGKLETEQALAKLHGFSSGVRGVIENTASLHDGRWLWLRPLSLDDVSSIESLLTIKRKPEKK